VSTEVEEEESKEEVGKYVGKVITPLAQELL